MSQAQPRQPVACRPGVTVVIATALAPHRVACLNRAIASARQAGVEEIIVVVNGKQFDAPAFARLRERTDLRLDYLEVGSYPLGQRRGRELVTQEFFCLLDDDDELLPDSIAARLDCALSSGADIVVANGYRCLDGVDTPYCRHQPDVNGNLLLQVLRENWFASCAPLFKSSSVGLEYFDGQTKYYEWTLLIFRFVGAGMRIAFVPNFGFRIHDTAASLSKDSRGVLAVPDFLRTLLTLTDDAAVKIELRRRLASAHHACADVELRAGARSRAWRHHLISLKLPGGAAYLAYTRKLIAAAFR